MKPLLFLRGQCLFSGPLSPSRPDPCLVSICQFFFLYGLFVDTMCSLSLSQALGNPKLFWFGVPLVFLQPGHALRPRSVRLLHLHQGIAPHLFFFFSSSSLISGSVFARPCSVGVGFLGGCFFCLWSLFFSVRCIARQT